MYKIQADTQSGGKRKGRSGTQDSGEARKRPHYQPDHGVGTGSSSTFLIKIVI
jgi:hypothetical protein